MERTVKLTYEKLHSYHEKEYNKKKEQLRSFIEAFEHLKKQCELVYVEIGHNSLTLSVKDDAWLSRQLLPYNMKCLIDKDNFSSTNSLSFGIIALDGCVLKETFSPHNDFYSVISDLEFKNGNVQILPREVKLYVQ